MIVRAIGPSLGAAGVSGALADTVLELHEPNGTVITNDNWRDTQEAEIIATTVPPSNDLESAIVATLEPGNYTAIVSGKNGGTGIALVEAYDLDSTVDSQSANISTRGFVETGNNVMIGGLIVGGNTGAVALRAIGPSLTGSGVTDALADPFLELHDNNGHLVASNDNWGDSADKQVFIDNGIAPTNDKESIILGVLAPGGYTAIVSGVSGGTGVGLVEAYNLHSTVSLPREGPVGPQDAGLSPSSKYLIIRPLPRAEIVVEGVSPRVSPRLLQSDARAP